MQKLELTWIGKGQEPAVEPRILLHDPSRDYGDPGSENMLIHGDNLLALKALEQQFAGKVKCIYIDPPYNTGSAFEHYDDSVEHSTWLSLVKSRLEIMRRLLSVDGSIWISIDDYEGHYLKVLCDEIFGRANFITTVVWQKRTSPDNRLRLGGAHDFILVYVRTMGQEKSFNQLPTSDARSSDYKNYDNDPRGAWASVDLTGQTGHATASQFYVIETPSGKRYPPPEGRCWALSEETFLSLVADNRIWFGKKGDSRPRQKRFIHEMSGVNSWSWWTNNEVGHNQEAKKENISLFGADSIFDTPKPERLLERILLLATNPGDLVLDSFLGSGTTAAVAHKMGRRWIGIELGDHCYTHCIPRLQKVVDGEQGGISQSVGWQGGGGFKFYELAPTLIVKDRYGNQVIDAERYSPEMLAAAVAKLNGYYYAPDATIFWKQGHSQESSYIFTTTTYLSARQLDEIAREVSPAETLLICCPAFDNGLNTRYDNITIKKIPQSVLDKCEYGKDHYDLNIIDVPEPDEEDEEVDDE